MHVESCITETGMTPSISGGNCRSADREVLGKSLQKKKKSETVLIKTLLVANKRNPTQAEFKKKRKPWQGGVGGGSSVGRSTVLRTERLRVRRPVREPAGGILPVYVSLFPCTRPRPLSLKSINISWGEDFLKYVKRRKGIFILQKYKVKSEVWLDPATQGISSHFHSFFLKTLFICI